MKLNVKGLKLFNFRLVISKWMNVLEISWCMFKKKIFVKYLFFLIKVVFKIYVFEMNCIWFKI